MKNVVLETLAKVFGVVLLVVGIGALIGGNFAHSYVTDQLSQENISMPTEESIANLPEESQDALRPFLGQKMTTGDQAQAFANNYIYEHMQTQCKTVKDAAGNELPAVEDCTYAGLGAAVRNADTDAAKAAYQKLRDTNFQGSTLRSMLLTSYAFWLVGSIAWWAGIACLVLGVVLLALGFAVYGPKARKASVQTLK